MELLVLSLDFPPNDGGISRLAAGAVSALDAAGVKVRVVTFASEHMEGAVRPKCEIAEINRRKGLRDWQMFWLVRRRLAGHGADAPILTSVWNPEATIAMLAGARRVVILAHGNEVMQYPRQGIKAWLRRLVLRRAKIVVCNSIFTEGLVKRIAPRAHTVVLNPAIDADRFTTTLTRHEARRQLSLPIEKRIVLTVARLDPIKGHETVLRALAKLTEAVRSNLLYVIIGKGEMRDKLVALADKLSVTSNVQFAGFVADPDLPTWYRAADLFVLPSVVDPGRRGMEGFGMALTEAQAAGVPVIGSRSGGIPDAICESEGGWLIDERDHVALAGHLQRLIEAPDSFEDQGLRGAARVRREMTWELYGKRLMEVL